MYGSFFGKSKSLEKSGVCGGRPCRTSTKAWNNPFKYIVHEGDTVTSVAIKTNSTVNRLVELNPSILINGKRTHLYVGQALAIDKAGEVILPPTPDDVDNGWGQIHVVHANDTLESIAEEYNTTEIDIRRYNREWFPAGEKGQLFPGQMLRIRMINTIDSELCEEYTKPSGEYTVHSVESTDTFESICSSYKITYDRLIELNRLHFPIGCRIELKTGQQLLIDQKDKSTSSLRNIAEVILTKQIHLVKEEDTPESICDLYDMTLAELRDLNRAYFPKGYRGEIRKGLQLVVKKQDETSTGYTNYSSYQQQKQSRQSQARAKDLKTKSCKDKMIVIYHHNSSRFSFSKD